MGSAGSAPGRPRGTHYKKFETFRTLKFAAHRI